MALTPQPRSEPLESASPESLALKPRPRRSQGDLESARLRQRLTQDRQALSLAYGTLAGVLEPTKELEAGLREAADPLLTACRLAGRSRGIDFRAPRWRSDDSHDALAEICENSRVRHRKVLLRVDWWRRDNGPLVGFLRGEGEGRAPVALLPVPGGYELVDPLTSSSAAVDSRLAEELENEAWMFYTPLPSRPLALPDLVRVGRRGLGRELRMLAGVSLAAGLLALLPPLLTRYVVGWVLPTSDRVELGHIVAALALGALAGALFQVTRGFALLRFMSRADGTLQAAVWDRLMALPVAFFRRFTVGDLEARARGIDQIRELMSGHVVTSVLALSYAAFNFAILFAFSVRLALLATVLVIALGGGAGVIAMRQLRHQRALQDVRGKLASLLYALLSGIAKLRISGAEQRAFAVWAARFAEQRRHTVAAQKLSNLQTVIASVYGLVGSLALFTMVGYSSTTLRADDFLAFNTAFAQFQAAALAAISVLPTLLAAVPVFERMRPILEAVPEVHNHQAEVGKLTGEVELSHASFRYRGDGPLVLEDISLRAGPGEFVALVGPSGSGKSTSLRVMLGFERPESGAVFFDGEELSSLDVGAVRRQIGAVLQSGRPLVGDIFTNIVGSRNLTLEDAWRAARMVALEDEIKAMPMGMHTYINQRGTTFSGGQRQRLLIARAIVNRPRIVLLDEALSALDNRTQEIVARSLDRLDATRIVVAHRLSTIKRADRIYVLDRGRIVDFGTYEELIEREGLFRCMAQRQIV